MEVSRLDEEEGECRVQGQRCDLAADLCQLLVLVECSEHEQSLQSLPHDHRRGWGEEGKVLERDHVERLELQEDLRDVHALDLRDGQLRETLEGFLGVQSEALARGLSARSTSSLVGLGLGDRHALEHLHASLLVDEASLHEASVHH